MPLILGTSAADFGTRALTGTPENDTIGGLGGDDFLDGGDGDDVLIGGLGRDTLVGGAGADVFFLNGIERIDAVILDYNAAEGDVVLVDTPNLPADLGFQLRADEAGVLSFLPSVLHLVRSDASALGQIVMSFNVSDRVETFDRVVLRLPFGDTPGQFTTEVLDATTLGGGSAGNDTLSGTAHDEWIAAGEGDDLIRAMGDAQNSSGNDTLLGWAGNDTILGGSGAFYGGEGDDELTGQGLFQLFGGEGNDLLVEASRGPRVQVQLYGGAGDDTVRLESEDFWFTTIDGGEGNDLLALPNAASERSIVTFGTDDEVMIYWLPSDVDMFYRNVTVTGFEQIAFSDRTVSFDTLRDETGTPLTRIGGEEADLLEGASAADRLIGNGGDDTLRGGYGNDTLNGGAGDDFLYGGAAFADLRDVIFGGEGNDYADGGAGNDEISGGAGDDTLAGGLGADTLIGNGDDDLLAGGGGSDLLFGNEGNDFLNGGFGYDRLNGGAGADTFFHQGVADHGSDWVQDYNAAEGDLLVAGIADATASQFQVIIATTAGTGDAGLAEAFVIYRPTGQILWALVDGAGQTSINLQIGGQVFDLLA